MQESHEHVYFQKIPLKSSSFVITQKHITLYCCGVTLNTALTLSGVKQKKVGTRYIVLQHVRVFVLSGYISTC